MINRRNLIVILGLVISAAFLWFALRGLHPEDAIDSLSRINIWWLIFGAAWYFVALSVITMRWQFLLRAVKYIPVLQLMPLVMIGYMGNNVYPFRSGEALRIYLLRRNHRVPIVKGMTTVLIERVFDGLVMLTFLFVPLLFVEIASEEVRQVATFATPIFLTALVTFFVLAAQPNLLRRLVNLVERLLPETLANLVDSFSEDVISGLEGLRSPAYLAGAVLTSYATWLLESSVYWIVSFAFGLDLSYWVMLLVVGTVNLAGLIPASPGQLGVFEFFVAAVLVGVGVAEAEAVTYALVVHLVIWLPVTVVGFFFLARQGLGLDAIARAQQMDENLSNQAAVQ